MTLLYADTEQLLIGWCPTAVTCRAVTEVPENLATVLAAMPVVRITRIGGPSAVGFDQPLIDFDCFGLDRPPAKQFAIALSSAVESRLAGYFNQYGTVNRADTISGPSWRPWENPNVRRFGFTTRLVVHAR